MTRRQHPVVNYVYTHTYMWQGVLENTSPSTVTAPSDNGKHRSPSWNRVTQQSYLQCQHNLLSCRFRLQCTTYFWKNQGNKCVCVTCDTRHTHSSDYFKFMLWVKSKTQHVMLGSRQHKNKKKNDLRRLSDLPVTSARSRTFEIGLFTLRQATVNFRRLCAVTNCM